MGLDLVKIWVQDLELIWARVLNPIWMLNQIWILKLARIQLHRSFFKRPL